MSQDAAFFGKINAMALDSVTPHLTNLLNCMIVGMAVLEHSPKGKTTLVGQSPREGHADDTLLGF